MFGSNISELLVVSTCMIILDLEFNLSIGGNSSGTSRLEVYHTGSVDNLMLIRNASTNTGIKVDGDGRFQLLEFASLPSPVEGGIVYASNEFYVGM